MRRAGELFVILLMMIVLTLLVIYVGQPVTAASPQKTAGWVFIGDADRNLHVYYRVVETDYAYCVIFDKGNFPLSVSCVPR